MQRALWAIAVLAAVALGTAIIGTVVNNNDVRAQSAKISAIRQHESADRAEIATLRAELQAKAAVHVGTS